MRQRFFLNGSRKNGFVVTVSTRTLKVARRSSLSGLLHQKGTRPQRISTSSRFPSCSTIVSAGSVGQALKRLEIRNRRGRCQAIEGVDLLPRIISSETSTHAGNIGVQRSVLYHRAQFEARPWSFGSNRSPPN